MEKITLTKETLRSIIKIAFMDGAVADYPKVEDAHSYAEKEVESGMISLFISHDKMLQELQELRKTVDKQS